MKPLATVSATTASLAEVEELVRQAETDPAQQRQARNALSRGLLAGAMVFAIILGGIRVGAIESKLAKNTHSGAVQTTSYSCEEDKVNLTLGALDKWAQELGDAERQAPHISVHHYHELRESAFRSLAPKLKDAKAISCPAPSVAVASGKD